MKKLDYDPKEHDPGKILNIISREKGDMVTHIEYEAKESSNDFQKTMVTGVWREYETILKEEKALDFDDLLLKTALLLKNDNDVRNYYQNKWKYFLIDEYQDTNEVQYNIIKMLAAKSRNICVVGDIDQNIYSWRGATIKNILHFEKDYPEAKVITLEQNYRSTKTILEVANEIIELNKNRRDKNLFTENDRGDKITLYNAYNENDESRFVSEKCDELIRSGVKPNDIAVLYRANFQSRVLEEAFLSLTIPYQVLGTRFFDRKEIKDVLSFIKAAMNPEDLNSLGRIINVPPRGIGKVTFLKIAEGHETELKGAIAIKVQNFRNMLKEINVKINNETPSEVIKFILKRSGMEEDFRSQNEEGQERLENVKELGTLASKYDEMLKPEGVEKLLEDAALATDQDNLEKDNGGVKLMTVHASKGLEFDYVFITGLEEGLFPHERMNEKKEDDEEERRLFYVAVTRAGKKLYLTYAGIRTIFGSQQVNVPSQFLNDINEKHVETEDNDTDETTFSAKDIFIDF
jgi:DNA helicase-2/ATP-dependent DNA helicase PcrA